MTPPPIRQPVRIIGIDPGLRRTGWGVIETEGNRLVFIGCGSVEPRDDLPLASRLLAIHEGLAAVLGDFRPAEAAVHVRPPSWLRNICVCGDQSVSGSFPSTMSSL